MACMQKLSGLINSGGKRKCFLREATLVKVENVSWKQKTIIIQNRYQTAEILIYFHYKIYFLNTEICAANL
jgi:hypothetical protein